MNALAPHEVLEPTPEGQVLALAAEIAVLCAEPEFWQHEVLREALKCGNEFLGQQVGLAFDLDGFVSALTHPGRGGEWRGALAELVSLVSPQECFVRLADNAIYSDLLEEDLLYGGVFQRRLDAVLDLAEAPFCVADVQRTFHALLQNLADAKVTWAHTGFVLAGNFAAGFAGAAFGVPGANFASGKGTDLFLNRVASMDELVESSARLLVAANAAISAGAPGSRLLEEVQEHLIEQLVTEYRTVDKARQRRASGLNVDVSAPQRRARILQAATEDVTRLSETSGGARTVPDVRGMSASCASWLLDHRGARYEFKDGSPQKRGVWNLDAWRVISQDHAPNTDVTKGLITLKAVKYDDR